MTSELVHLSVVNKGSGGQISEFSFCYQVKRDDGGEYKW
jgi:hypothetical protein